MMLDLVEQLDHIMPTALAGSVARTAGTTVSATGFPAPVGAVAEIQRQSGSPLLAEVIGFRDDVTVLYPLSDLSGVRRGNQVRLLRTARWLRVGPELLGRVIDAQGNAVDGQPAPASATALRSIGPRPNLAPVRGSTSPSPPACAPSTAY